MSCAGVSARLSVPVHQLVVTKPASKGDQHNKAKHAVHHMLAVHKVCMGSSFFTWDDEGEGQEDGAVKGRG